MSLGLAAIRRSFLSVLANWVPDSVVLERPGKWMQRPGTSRHSIETMAMSRGVMLEACAEFGVIAVEVDFQEARARVLGWANGTKAEAAAFVASLGLGVPHLRSGRVDEDVVDAIVMALYGLTVNGGPRAAVKRGPTEHLSPNY